MSLCSSSILDVKRLGVFVGSIIKDHNLSIRNSCNCLNDKDGIKEVCSQLQQLIAIFEPPEELGDIKAVWERFSLVSKVNRVVSSITKWGELSENEEVSISDNPKKRQKVEILPEKNLQELKLTTFDAQDVDFSIYENLTSLDLSDIRGLTAEKFNSIPNKGEIGDLKLSSSLNYSRSGVPIDVTGFDFSGFTNLKILHLHGVKNLTSQQFNSIPNKFLIKDFSLKQSKVLDFDFSEFLNLEKLELYMSDLSSEQFNSITKKFIKDLDLFIRRAVDYDFSGFVKLEYFKGYFLKVALTATQFNEMPKAFIKELELDDDMELTDFDFSGFSSLKKMNNLKKMSARQFNAIPKDFIEELDLSGIDITFFDLSKLVKVKILELRETIGLTFDKFNRIPADFIEDVKLSFINMYLFDFSELVAIKNLTIVGAEGLTANQFNNLPNKSLIEKLCLQGVNLAGFIFSDLTGLRELDLWRGEGVTVEQFRSIPNKLSLENFNASQE
jgi:hypothetical protein